jgi:sugar/nucleoside kinase (ribokinase family)
MNPRLFLWSVVSALAGFLFGFDTVGAGDAFTAALVVGWLRGDQLTTIARTACEIAAAVCAQPGAVPARMATPNEPRSLA